MRLGPLDIVTSTDFVSGPDIIFTVFGLPVTITVVTTWVIILLSLIIFKLGTRQLNVIPGKFQTYLETIYNFLDDLMESILGKFKNKYFNFIGTMFVFIFISNIVSFFPIPWLYQTEKGLEIDVALRNPTADLNTTVGLAILTTIAFVGTNLKYKGLSGYLKGFLDPFPAILPLNIVGELAKPVNISMRLFGNMFAGSVIMGILYLFVPWVVPAAFHLYFDLVSALVQTFVFVLLTMVYIQGGLPEE